MRDCVVLSWQYISKSAANELYYLSATDFGAPSCLEYA